MMTSTITERSSDSCSELEGGQHRPTAAARNILGALLGFAALNAFAGGSYGLLGAKGVPKDWLEGSPFRSYFVPSLILVVIVGGSFLLAAVAVFRRWRHDRFLTIAAAVVVFGWLATQVAIIGYVSWMQPATAIAGALVLLLAQRLPSPSSAGRVRRRTRDAAPQHAVE